MKYDERPKSWRGMAWYTLSRTNQHERRMGNTEFRTSNEAVNCTSGCVGGLETKCSYDCMTSTTDVVNRWPINLLC